MNPLETINLALKVWALLLEGMTIEQRQRLTQRFLDDTDKARENFDGVLAWFVGLTKKAQQ